MRKSLLTPLFSLAAALLLGLAAPLFAAPSPAAADVDDFSYDSWHVDYEVGLDDTGRAFARVAEALTPRFPEFDQNRGIVRALPMRYRGAPAAPENISVHDADGIPVPFEIEDDEGFRLILVGDDRFVHGVQHWVITYTIRDVILAVPESTGEEGAGASDSGDGDGTATAEPAHDEFYWNLLPIDRRQDIDEFSARVVLAPELASRLLNASACYTGGYGSALACEMRSADVTEGAHAGSAVFTVPPMPVPLMQGVTVAIGLQPDSAVQPPERLPSFAYDELPGVLAGGSALAGLAGAVGVGVMRRKRRTGRGTVIAQYEAPRELPPLIAAPLVQTGVSPLPAEFVHLAVNGSMRIEELEPGKKKPKLAFRLLDPASNADPLDHRAVRAIFGKGAKVGTQFRLPKRDQAFQKRMQKLRDLGVSEAERRGYTEKAHSRFARVCGVAALILALGTVPLLVLGQSRDNSTTFVVALFLGIPGILFGVFALRAHLVLTPSGAAAREHLLGVREFIRVAEADRLQMLQSYTGADRRNDGTVDVVHLYERLLPYAMLFRLEKSWSRALQQHYESTGISSPDWYPAIGLYGMTHLDRSVSGLARSFTAASSYASSGSGGSSGGGFSGGGGGGGFSGGR